MARNYYYLVSSLPDLLIDDSKNVPAFRTVVGEVMDELSTEDREFVSAMMRPVDNRNLVNMLEQNSEEFDDRGNYSREELAAAVRMPGDLPEYMQVFMSAHKESRQLFPGLSALDQLTWLFYDAMAESGNDFSRNWFEFDANLRNVAVGINIRKELGHIEALATDRDRPAALTVVGRGDAAEAVLRSTAPDFGLASSLPWVEKVNALSKGGLTDMEKGLDELRWGMLDELSPLDYFQAETVAVFMVKLQIVYRWLKLDPVTGREKLDKLVSELMESFVMPEGF
ncbi:MAG: DUF2764 domain-containing protein [Chitinispirillales bacterium]|jgi:hypothetical protein|nr:DUF2764 domain-containing protein [Chitinispirillales bacterium]